MNAIIFSKDRACQLELLLRSMQELAPVFLKHVAIIYRVSSDSFLEGYRKLQDQWPRLRWMLENKSFKEMVIDAVDETPPHTLFFVDDLVFRKKWDGSQSRGYQSFCANSKVLCYSLRISKHLTFCHPKNAKEYSPVFSGNCWSWAGCTPTYAYPMSVDGHIFRTGEILVDLVNLDYENPNSLEGILVQRSWLRGRCPLMSCDKESTIFGIPANLVNTVYKNRSMGGSAEELNQRWLDGERIALEPLIGYPNKAVHEEVEYTFEKAHEPQ